MRYRVLIQRGDEEPKPLMDTQDGWTIHEEYINETVEKIDEKTGLRHVDFTGARTVVIRGRIEPK